MICRFSLSFCRTDSTEIASAALRFFDLPAGDLAGISKASEACAAGKSPGAGSATRREIKSAVAVFVKV